MKPLLVFALLVMAPAAEMAGGHPGADTGRNAGLDSAFAVQFGTTSIARDPRRRCLCYGG